MMGEAATLAEGRLRLLKFTLAAVGKSTKTLSPKVPELTADWLIELPKPFSEAYKHGEGLGLSAVAQSNWVPAVNFAVLGIAPSVSATSISMTPAVQAASAAV